MSRTVVVGSPGGHPWLAEIGAGLARAGLLREYITPFGNPAKADGPVPLTTHWFDSELRKRDLPPGLTADYVHHAARAHESLFVVAQRTQMATTERRLQIRAARDRHFDRCVARRLRLGDTAAIGFQNAALDTFRTAATLQIESFLDYAIAHHGFARRLLQQEAALNPEYASTLQFHNLPSPMVARMEQEIAIADHILCLSTFQKTSFVEMGAPADKLLMSPPGVDLEMFKPAPEPRNDGRFRILFKGQITQRKGVSYLVEGFRRAAIPGSELLLAGRVVGSTKPWRDIPGVRHVDHMPHRSQTVQLYQSADVFAVPSIVEGFLLTGLEAMACGIPVILTPHTFGPDVITDGIDGFIVPIRDPDAVADRLRFLYEHPELRRLVGERARRRAEAFSWEAYGDRVAQAVGALAARSDDQPASASRRRILTETA